MEGENGYNTVKELKKLVSLVVRDRGGVYSGRYAVERVVGKNGICIRRIIVNISTTTSEYENECVS